MSNRDAERQAREDGYVECSECGHPIEEHDSKGCQTCAAFTEFDPQHACTVPWTQAEIVAHRKSLGLPAEYDDQPGSEYLS